jgi:sortase A
LAATGTLSQTKSNSRQRKRPLLALIQGRGEVLITFEVVGSLYVGWSLWGTNLIADHAQKAALHEFAGSCCLLSPGRCRSIPPGSNGEVFGVVYIPPFGSDYSRPLVQGTGADVLDTLGLGHYAKTSMPGEIGNFAIAGHRQTHGAVLDNIDKLVPGDKIYVQTQTAYYVYVYRNNEIVIPSQIQVLLPVPMTPELPATQPVMTMTSCNPRFGSQERIIAYSVVESWRPASAGPPAEIAPQVAQLKGSWPCISGSSTHFPARFGQRHSCCCHLRPLS